MQRVDGYVVELRGDALLAPKLEELLLREPLGTPAGVGQRVPPIELVTVGLAAPKDLLVRPRREVESLLKPRLPPKLIPAVPRRNVSLRSHFLCRTSSMGTCPRSFA